MNPFEGLAKLVVDLVKAHRLQEWCKLIFSILFSSAVTFCWSTGTALVAGAPSPIAIGTGLISGSCMAMFVANRTSLTKGMMLGFPEAGLQQSELDEKFVTVTRK